jgi:hypothetical protein
LEVVGILLKSVVAEKVLLDQGEKDLDKAVEWSALAVKFKFKR